MDPTLRKLLLWILENPKVEFDQYSRNVLDHFYLAIRLRPMKDVLPFVPGENVKLKARQIGVSRNTWYAWWSGRVRPNKKQAQRLQKLTSIPANQFQGRR